MACQSVLHQRYKRWRLVLAYDDDRCLEYLRPLASNPKVRIVRSIEVDRTRQCFYNLYVNPLVQGVSDGWIIVLDDDDMFASPSALLRVAQNLSSPDILVTWPHRRGAQVIKGLWNQGLAVPGTIASCSYCVHSSKARESRWRSGQRGDYAFLYGILQQGPMQIRHLGPVLTKSVRDDQRGGNFGATEEPARPVLAPAPSPPPAPAARASTGESAQVPPPRSEIKERSGSPRNEKPSCANLHTTLVGGLGNQLFMLFNLASLSERYGTTFSFWFDEDYVERHHKTTGLRHTASNGWRILDGCRDKYRKRDTTSYRDCTEKSFRYEPVVLERGFDYNVSGYFQSPKYFQGHEHSIKEHLSIDLDMVRTIRAAYRAYGKKVLAIHIRLTDYAGLPDHHPIPPLDYYRKALSPYDIDAHKIVVFSDDPEGAVRILGPLNLDMTPAGELSTDTEFQFYMLALADVRICANSSFSLMSCFLNEMYSFIEDAEYTFPCRWFGAEGPDYDITDIIPPDNPRFRVLNVASLSPLVSILIPTHDLRGKQVAFMKKTLPIIFNQTYKNFEVVITDNNDGHETRDFVLKEFPRYYRGTRPTKHNIDSFDASKIKYTYCATKGWSPNHNNGLAHCTGDLVKILHQDNYFLNEHSLENVVTAFEDEGMKWLVSSYWHQNEEASNGKLYRYHVPEYSDKIANGGNPIGDPSCLTIRKECILDFNIAMKYIVDCEYYFRLKQAFGAPVVQPMPSIVVLQHSDQVTHSLTIEEVLQEHFALKRLAYCYGVECDEYPWWVSGNVFSPDSTTLYERALRAYNITTAPNDLSRTMKTYYINLDERPDRNEEVLAELEKAGITKFERFAAVKPDRKMIEGTELIEVDKLWPKDDKPPDINNEKDFKYIRGATGCKLSHYRILKKFYIEDKEEFLLVLEDDCVLSETVLSGIRRSLLYLEERNIKFNILYLSATIHHHRYHKLCQKVSEDILKLRKGWGNTTHAMVFSRRTVSGVLGILEKSDTEIDEVYKNQVDHRYVINPMIGYQRPSPSDIGLFREEERNITNGSIVYYGNLEGKYDYSDIGPTGIRHLVYRPNGPFNSRQVELFYRFLIRDLNLGEAQSLDRFRTDIIYICFCHPSEIPPPTAPCRFIYVNDHSSDISWLSSHPNMQFFLDADIDRFVKHRDDFSIRHKVAFLGDGMQALHSCGVTANIISLDQYRVEMDSEMTYVVSLPHSAKRRQAFEIHNAGIRYEFVSAVLYNPGWLGCAMSHKLLIQNAQRSELEIARTCEDDCIVHSEAVINEALGRLVHSGEKFELLSCFMSEVREDVVIKDVIPLEGGYNDFKDRPMDVHCL